jgi:hypothetical protein
LFTSLFPDAPPPSPNDLSTMLNAVAQEGEECFYVADAWLAAIDDHVALGDDPIITPRAWLLQCTLHGAGKHRQTKQEKARKRRRRPTVYVPEVPEYQMPTDSVSAPSRGEWVPPWDAAGLPPPLPAPMLTEDEIRQRDAEREADREHRRRQREFDEKLHAALRGGAS